MEYIAAFMHAGLLCMQLCPTPQASELGLVANSLRSGITSSRLDVNEDLQRGVLHSKWFRRVYDVPLRKPRRDWPEERELRDAEDGVPRGTAQERDASLRLGLRPPGLRRRVLQWAVII
jgi:hypothetical protein